MSLFPFLSILCCLIGLLTLMIKIISDIKAMERGQNQEEIALALENQKVQKQIAEEKQKIEKLRKELENKGAATVEMRELEDRRIILRREFEKAKAANPEDSDAMLQRRIEALLQQIGALKKERPPLDEKIVALTKELEALKIEANAKPPPVVVQPRGLGAEDVNLRFIECESAGIVIRMQDGTRVSVSKAAIPTEPALAGFLNEAKADRKSLVLFLLRTDGNESYNIAAGWAEHQFGLRTAKLPIPNKGDIDLSKFNR
ncbi:MAG: hypothetical protein EOP87_05985 [Verrucomicrobiaceae bacterium]|nr:MAG: hypothetical protein EOP87_05985 [Verrucomicrobiaceae bacterium]